MVVISRGAFLFREHGENYLLKRDVLTSIPSWVAESSFFAALVREGRIVISETTKDAEVEKAVKAAEKKEAAVQAEKIEKVKKTKKKA